MRNCVITIKWNPETDNTKINYNDEFIGMYRIGKLDMLKDAIFDLTERYNSELDKFIEGKIEGDLSQTNKE